MHWFLFQMHLCHKHSIEIPKYRRHIIPVIARLLVVNTPECTAMARAILPGSCCGLVLDVLRNDNMPESPVGT